MAGYHFVPSIADRSAWTVGDVLRSRAASHADRVYLDVPSVGVALTYRETAEVAHRIGSGLLAADLQQGDRVVVMMPNNPEYILTWLGTAVAGLVEVPINTAYRGTFLEHQVRTVAPTAAVITAELAERFAEAAAACGTITTFYLVGEPGDAPEILQAAGFAVRGFEELRSAEPGPLPEIRPQDLAAIFFTSGTTGLSKGVAMSHAQLFFFADEGRALVRLTDEDVYLSVGPLFHGNAQFLTAYPSLIAGARYVLREKLSASRWTSWLRESGVTVTNLVGVMSDFLWKQPARPDDAVESLRCVWAVPNPPESVAEQFKARFGIEVLVENFGLTEVSMPILTPYDEPRPAGAAGRVVEDWFEVRLVDPETDEEVPVGEVGELVVRPKVPWIICNGYFGMPDKTAEALRNCWFHTGDGLRRDEDGWYYFVDRLKDALRRRGENISSFEVEQAILSHDGVAECAVVAVKAGGANEDEVMAVVVPAPGHALELEEFWAHCTRAMPAFAVPRYVRIVEELPKTPSGKIQKAELRGLGASGAADRESQPVG